MCCFIRFCRDVGYTDGVSVDIIKGIPPVAQRRQWVIAIGPWMELCFIKSAEPNAKGRKSHGQDNVKQHWNSAATLWNIFVYSRPRAAWGEEGLSPLSLKEPQVKKWISGTKRKIRDQGIAEMESGFYDT